MPNVNFENQFKQEVSPNLLNQELLSKYTTMGIGGPAEYFFIATSSDQIRKIVILTERYNIPLTVLGGGSNVVIADEGLKGLVVRNEIRDFELLPMEFHSDALYAVPRRLVQPEKDAYYDASKFDSSFDESTLRTSVKVGSGWKINALVQRLLQDNITGLEWFMGIPGTIGGAVYMNMHGGAFFISDFVTKVESVAKNGETKTYTNSMLDFAYDYSVLHKTKDIVTAVTLHLYRGNVSQGKKIAAYWGVEKIKHQPQRSAGCMFRNLSKEEQERLNLPTSSIGYIIDKVLKLSGKQVGGARISPSHAAFIENISNASAMDVESLVKLVEQTFADRFGFELKREVEFLKSKYV